MSVGLLMTALPLLLLLPRAIFAGPPDATSHDVEIRSAVIRGLPIVQKAAENYPQHRNCFSCHHQTLPMLAMTAARDHGISTNVELLQSQAEFTLQSFQSRIESMKEGKGIGGTSMTVGYGLWALDLAGWKADETTEAMVTFLLKNQDDKGHWTPNSIRPPLEDSTVMATVLAAYGMQRYASPSQKSDVEAAITKAKAWLAEAPLESQEDKAARLWGLHLLGASVDQLAVARKAVLEEQGEDGGWSQLPDMGSDAYATGQSLFVLQATGLATSDPAYQRGVKSLLDTQCDDGSWFVETRSKPIQVFFDNGDPHDKNQFISIPATSWAVAALAAACKPAGSGK